MTTLRALATRQAAVFLLAWSVVGCSRQTDQTETLPPPGRPDSAIVDPVASPIAPLSHLIDSLGVAELRRQGLRDPLAQIVDSLMAHPELIPHEGVLGGRMGFYSPGRIHVLDESWVYAEFDDGHIQGRGIFEYTVQPDSSLAFKAVHSVVD